MKNGMATKQTFLNSSLNNKKMKSTKKVLNNKENHVQIKLCDF